MIIQHQKLVNLFQLCGQVGKRNLGLFFFAKDAVIQLGFDVNSNILYPFKSESSTQFADITIIVPNHIATQSLSRFKRDVCGNKRVSISISTGPKSKIDQWVYKVFLIKNVVFDILMDIADRMIKHVLQIPHQAFCFVKWRWLFFLKKRSSTELSKQNFDGRQIIGLNGS